MKKVLFFLIFILSSLAVFGQEFEGEKREIPAENRKLEKEIPILESLDLVTRTAQMGPFDVARYAIPINLLDIGFPKGQDVDVDIMAISKAKEYQRKSQIRDVELTRQARQIRSQVKIFSNRQKNSWDNSNRDFQYDSKRAPDGGIRNEALREIRQPFMNPYRRNYNSRYYNSFPRHYGSGSGFHFYRR